MAGNLKIGMIGDIALVILPSNFFFLICDISVAKIEILEIIFRWLIDNFFNKLGRKAYWILNN